MFKTIYLGKLLGIEVYIHWSFWFLAILIGLSNLHLGFAPAMSAVGFIFAVFGCVFLHEMGHAVAGTWFGIRTRDITLLPIGGVARMKEFPKQPLPELVVALAGPAVNVLIAAALLFGISIKLAWSHMHQGGLASLGWMEQLLLANVGLVVFNMIPAFPMDGGRVLRSSLAFFMPHDIASIYAARVGQVLAVVLFLASIYLWSFSLFLISGFVFFVCSGELLRASVANKIKTQFDAFEGRRDSTSGQFDFYPANRPHANSDGDTIDAVEVKKVL